MEDLYDFIFTHYILHIYMPSIIAFALYINNEES